MEKSSIFEDEPVGSSIWPWKSLNDSSCTVVVLSARGAAVELVAPPTEATRPAATRAASATGVRRRRSPGPDMVLLGGWRGDWRNLLTGPASAARGRAKS